jgi:hypothetical protein
MRLPSILASLVVLTAVGIVALFRHDLFSGHRQEVPSDVANEMMRLRAELGTLKESVQVSERFSRVAVQTASLKPAGAFEPALEATKAEHERGPDKSKPAGRPLADWEVTDRLDRRLRGEAPDPNWSKPTQKLITDHVKQGLPAESQVVSIECGRTLCRVESRHPDLKVYKRFVDDALLFPQGGWEGPIMTAITGRDPNVKSNSYLFRTAADAEGVTVEETPPNP